MLKVMLVDDEEIIRHGIRGTVEWEKLDMEVVGEAEDGQQGLAMLEEIHPDIIVTDIRMPFIDGLKFIEIVKKIHPEIYIVIVSGYDEFQYAQKAVNLGAYAYILKPIDLDSLNKILTRISVDFDSRRKRDNEFEQLKIRTQENLFASKGNIFKDIIYKRFEADEIEKRLSDFNIDVKNNYYAVVIVQIDDYYGTVENMDEEQSNFIQTSFYDLFDKSISEYNNLTAFKNSDCEYILCLMDEHREVLKDRISQISSTIRDSMKEITYYTITIAIGNIHDSILMLPNSYSEARSAVNYKFIVGKNHDIYYKSLNPIKNKLQIEDYNIDELISFVKCADEEGIKKSLNLLLTDIKAKGSDSYLYMQIITSNIYLQVVKMLNETGGLIEEVFADPIKTYKDIITKQAASDIIGELLSKLLIITNYIKVKKYGKFDIIIEKAKSFINKNYMKEDLPLQDVAKYVNMSTCYFSVVFKQEVGETFINYLTALRMEKAKELLILPGYKTYEISNMIGYSNSTYFSTIFKKYVGVSPTEYRNSLL